MKIFRQFDVCGVLNIESGVLAAWLKLMENHYHSSNSYHNSTHAADVLQATAYFVKLLQDQLVKQGVSSLACKSQPCCSRHMKGGVKGQAFKSCVLVDVSHIESS